MNGESSEPSPSSARDQRGDRDRGDRDARPSSTMDRRHSFSHVGPDELPVNVSPCCYFVFALSLCLLVFLVDVVSSLFLLCVGVHLLHCNCSRRWFVPVLSVMIVPLSLSPRRLCVRGVVQFPWLGGEGMLLCQGNTQYIQVLHSLFVRVCLSITVLFLYYSFFHSRSFVECRDPLPRAGFSYVHHSLVSIIVLVLFLLCFDSAIFLTVCVYG